MRGDDWKRANRLWRRTAELVERGWCQGSLATTGDGKRTGPLCDDARRWCVEGALIRARRDLGEDHALEDACMEALQDEVGCFPCHWNDRKDMTAHEVARTLGGLAAGVRDCG